MTQTRQDSTFETILDYVLPFAGPELIPDQGPLRHAARQLPPVPNGMFEIRLEQGNPQVDLITGFEAHQFPIFARWQQQRGDNAPPYLGQIAEALTAEHSYLREKTSGFGLEHDLVEGTNAELSGPSIFFIPKKEQRTDHTKLYTYAEALLSEFLLKAARDALLANTRNLLNALGEDSEVGSLGVMFSRKHRALRFQILGVPPKNLGSIFKTVKGAKVSPGLDAIIELAESAELPSVVCLDLAPHLQPAFGLEIYNSGTRPKKMPDRLLDLLVKERLCSAEKRLALERWAGSSIPPNLPPEWGGEAPYVAAPGSRRFFVRLDRHISHTKIMLDAHDQIQAKAYLEFYPNTAGLK